MIKIEELKDPSSCLNKARDDELLFVLLGRDIAAIAAVESWILERIALGKNNKDDKQIVDAQKWIASCMTRDTLAEIAGRMIKKALGDMSKYFTFVPGATLVEEPGEQISIEADLLFEYKGHKQKHAVVIGWREFEGIGLEVGEDSDIVPIHKVHLFQQFYYDVALDGLEE